MSGKVGENSVNLILTGEWSLCFQSNLTHMGSRREHLPDHTGEHTSS